MTKITLVVRLTSNDMFETRKHLQIAGYLILKICKNLKFRLTASCLPHYLTTFASLDTEQSIVQPQFNAITTNLPVRCAF